LLPSFQDDSDTARQSQFPDDLPDDTENYSAQSSRDVTPVKSAHGSAEKNEHPSKNNGIGTKKSLTEIMSPIEVSDSESEKGQRSKIKVGISSSPIFEKHSKWRGSNAPQGRVLNKEEKNLITVMTQAFRRDVRDDIEEDIKKLDDVAIFAEHVARQLRDITDKKQRLMLQNQIQSTIFNFQMHVWQEKDPKNPALPTYNYQEPYVERPQASCSVATVACNEQVENVEKEISPTKPSPRKRSYAVLQNANISSLSDPKPTKMNLRPKAGSVITGTMRKAADVEVPFHNL
jgi:hypothetical protein